MEEIFQALQAMTVRIEIQGRQSMADLLGSDETCELYLISGSLHLIIESDPSDAVLGFCNMMHPIHELNRQVLP
jgi:hypothetical protein